MTLTVTDGRWTAYAIAYTFRIPIESVRDAAAAIRKAEGPFGLRHGGPYLYLGAEVDRIAGALGLPDRLTWRAIREGRRCS